MIEPLTPDERAAAKAAITDPRTLEYVEHLEKIGVAALTLYKNTPFVGCSTDATRASLNALYDALKTVNFFELPLFDEEKGASYVDADRSVEDLG